MRKKLMKKVVALAMTLLVLTPVLAFSTPAFAAFDPWGNGDTNGNNFANNSGLPGTGMAVRDTIASIIRIIMGFLGIIAVVIILIGGFKWMTAGGNEDKVGEAKKLLVAGLIGLVIVIMAYAIAVFVINTMIDVTAGGGAGT